MEKEPSIAGNYPRNFSHLGITVPDIEKAYKFYTSALGWYTVSPPKLVKEDPSTPMGQFLVDVFGKGFGEMKVCHLLTGDRIGFAIIEFPGKQKGYAEYDPFRTGVFHYCVQDPDVEGLAAKILAAGGKQKMPIRHFCPGEPHRTVYMIDPFGNMLQIYSHSYEDCQRISAKGKEQEHKKEG